MDVIQKLSNYRKRPKVYLLSDYNYRLTHAMSFQTIMITLEHVVHV